MPRPRARSFPDIDRGTAYWLLGALILGHIGHLGLTLWMRPEITATDAGMRYIGNGLGLAGSFAALYGIAARTRWAVMCLNVVVMGTVYALSSIAFYLVIGLLAVHRWRLTE